MLDQVAIAIEHGRLIERGILLEDERLGSARAVRALVRLEGFQQAGRLKPESYDLLVNGARVLRISAQTDEYAADEPV